MKVDAYVRVSKVAGRSGESFISPTEQRRAIEGYAAAHNLEVAEWHEDLDQSGGTLERPAFQAALDRCRNGETGGIIAAKLDRLTRSTIGFGQLLEQAQAEGWNLIAVDQNLDLTTPNGKFSANLFANFAQLELERRGAEWAVTRRNFIERGVYNGRAPFGYRKDADGRLEVYEAEAKIVREAFAQRAAGVPFAKIGRPHGLAHTTIRQMLCNVAYLGIARAGEIVNENAHPAIVTKAQFDAAQVSRTVGVRPLGETTRDRLLVGLARCGGCGRTLRVVRRKRADGSYVVSYFCKDAASESCPERAFVHADGLDTFVGDWFAAALRDVPRMVDVVSQGRDLEIAQGELALAEGELHAFVEMESALDDAPLFLHGVAAKQAKVSEASERVSQLSARLTRLPAGGSLIDLWETFDALERRAVLASFIDRVDVRRGASSDLAGCTRIIWTDGTVAQDEAGIRVAAA